ncbi:hypothetical protein B4064_1111 [Caldibacillus thermoamylovorans]|nr:hypothetical protein B4064_1111 [Caldibacillus thermoamylovorans]
MDLNTSLFFASANMPEFRAGTRVWDERPFQLYPLVHILQ